MFRSSAVLCLLAATTLAGLSAQAAPPDLVQQRNQTLGELLEEKSNVARDLPAHAQVLILTCVYGRSTDKTAGVEQLHFWLGQTPQWLPTSANRQLLGNLVKGAATNCPGVLPASSAAVAAPLAASLSRASAAPSAGGDLKIAQLDPAFLKISLGDFSGLSFDRSDPRVVSLTEGYLVGFWDTCSRASSLDRTQITRRECTGGYYHTVNGFGLQTGPDICHGWDDVPTGKWADRKLYNAMRALQGQAERSLVKGMIGNVQTSRSLGDMYGNTINTVAQVAALGKQAASLVEQNGCDSPALAHFEQNLLHFALGGRPVFVNGASQASSATDATSLPRDADFQKLLGDAVLQASSAWLINKYVPRSVSSVSITQRDPVGRVEEIEGSYQYRGLGNGTGRVKLSFVDGIPSCLYFWDQPSNCNPVGKTLLADWERGYYH